MRDSRRRIVLSASALLAAFVQLLPAGHAVPPQAPLPQLLRSRVKDLAAGKLLVAARNLPDPNFSETVILLAEYGDRGAMGLIINRQTATPMSRVFQDLTGAKERSDAVYFGGPVAPTGAIALLRSATVTKGRRVMADVQMINTREELEAMIAARAEPNVFRVYLGYSGWGPGQLDMETGHGAWHVFPGNADLVFDSDPDSVWPRQIRWTDRLMARAPL
jgi:putative transcriptional regulator